MSISLVTNIYLLEEMKILILIEISTLKAIKPIECSLWSLYQLSTCAIFWWTHHTHSLFAKAWRQEIAGVKEKFGLGVKNEAGQRLTVLPREQFGLCRHPLPKTQGKTPHMDITRWSIPKSD